MRSPMNRRLSCGEFSKLVTWSLMKSCWNHHGVMNDRTTVRSCGNLPDVIRSLRHVMGLSLAVALDYKRPFSLSCPRTNHPFSAQPSHQPSQPRAALPGSAQPRPGQSSLAQSSSASPRLAQPSPAQLSSARPGPAQPGPDKPR